MKWKLIINKFLVLLLFVVHLKAAVFADEGGTVMEAVRYTISSQIDAFKQNDVKKAYTFAAPNIQAQFPSPDIFGLMVRNGYPIIWKPKSYKFTTFKDLGNRCIQRVLFQSYNGSLESYDYILEKNGSVWKIAGVLTIKSAGET
ncbi:MAG: hypothetical protein CBE31_00900 [Rhodobacterales bacterium TMED271]|jgi:hypothetical protein|nr:MAG: hypothetical protein CBE31_00900 [Rhodobacterales bacterium TMED271]|tara:strand:+ start:1905 stop:2336 length:432 start_codon:yes stop_codon:yes gene_type:complete